MSAFLSFYEDGVGAALDVTAKLNYTRRQTQKQHQELCLSQIDRYSHRQAERFRQNNRQIDKQPRDHQNDRVIDRMR